MRRGGAGLALVDRVVQRKEQRAVRALREIELAGRERCAPEAVENGRVRGVHLRGDPELGEGAVALARFREGARQPVMDVRPLLRTLVAVRGHLLAQHAGHVVPLARRLEDVGEGGAQRRVGGIPRHGELKERRRLRGLLQLVPVEVGRLARATRAVARDAPACGPAPRGGARAAPTPRPRGRAR